MLTVLEGQISFNGGLRLALLDIVNHSKVPQYGLLRVSSDKGTGLIGIALGRYMTGGVLTPTGEVHTVAIRKLLAAKVGVYTFVDALDEKLPELRQGLAVDIRRLLDAFPDLIGPQSLLTDELLMELSPPSMVPKFQAGVESKTAAEEKTRIAKLTRTYNRIVSISSGGWDSVPPQKKSADGSLKGKKSHKDGKQQESVTSETGERHAAGSNVDNQINDGNRFAKYRSLVLWSALVLAVVVIVALYGPEMLKFTQMLLRSLL